MNNKELVSKVLVCDNDDTATLALKEFFWDKGLLPLTCFSENVMELLSKNTDLGAVFLQFDGARSEECSNVIDLINRFRPELPIFVRVSANTPVDSLPDSISSVISCCYSLKNIETLETAVDNHLFSVFYPVPLIRGIQQITLGTIQSSISDITVSCDTPYLVKDQIIFGELLSLIPLESNWCRGFMMLQTTEEDMRIAIEKGHTYLSSENPSSRDVNELLNEITNLVWGKIKSTYFSEEQEELLAQHSNKIQVPIMVNHGKKFISFGSSEPQLCFKFTLIDDNDEFPPITLYQKLIFNLSWNPQKFKDSEQETLQLLDCGELEFF